MTRREALARYAADASRQSTGPQRIGLVKKFLSSGTPWTREGITGYLQALEKGGMAPATVDWQKRVLRSFGAKAELRWPGTSWKWNRTEAPSQQVASSPALVRTMLGALTRYDRRAAAYLVLSVLYGCRSGELELWSALCLAPGAAYIQREKHGESRWYWLPPAAEPWLAGRILHPLNRRTIYRCWEHICETSGVPRANGVSWHANRYALVRGLRAAGLPAEDTHSFLSWHPSEEKGPRIVAHYNGPTAELGADGQLRALRGSGAAPAPTAEELRARDARAWELHPFLPLL